MTGVAMTGGPIDPGAFGDLWRSIPADANLADGILRHARSAPDRPALIAEPETITYATLARQIVGLADGLRREGLGPGDRVALGASDVHASAVGMFGAALAGIVVVPVAPDLATEERDRLFRELSIVATLRGPADRDGLSVLDVATRGTAGEAESVRLPGGDRAATVMLSSGTTGRPKASVLSHRQQIWFLRSFAQALGTSADDRHLPIVAPSFAFGRNPMLRLLDAGGTVVVSAIPALVDDLVDLVRRQSITDLVLTPSHVAFLLARWQGDGPAFPALRRLVVSTAFLHHEERLRTMARLSPRLALGLGMNEVGYVTIAGPDEIARVPDTVGRALPGITIEVVDDSGRPMPPGEVGSLRVRGPNLPDGYLNDPEATRRNFREGWFHPGDLAMVDAEGFLFLAGRVDDRINRGGLKIYPIEIERVLRTHPRIADVAVVGLSAAREGEVAAAAVVLKGATPMSHLRAHCLERLGRLKTPTVFVRVDALPRNAMGKVPPDALRAMILDRLSKRRRPPMAMPD